jgi:transposase
MAAKDRMATSSRRYQPLPTIWQVPDPLWDRIGPILHRLDPPKPRGRPRIDPRAAMDAIIFRMRTGCQWNHLPRSFPDDSSVHRTFVRWSEQKILDAIWADLIEACEDLDGVDWEWQAVDGSMGKAVWGRPEKGDPHWSQPHRSRQERRKTLGPGGRSWLASGRGGGRSQRARCPAPGRHHSGHRSGAAAGRAGLEAAPAAGQGLRQRHWFRRVC